MTDKQNFEKDINVPSKEKLSDYACDAKDCEQYSDHICCLCRNREWYRLYKDYKRKEQECEFWKHQAELGSDTTDRLAKELEEKEQECERLKLQLAHSCHDVLYKNSLAGQLDQLKAENEELKTKLVNWLGKEGLRQSEKEFYEQQLEAYKMEAEEGKEINAELKAENDELRQFLSKEPLALQALQSGYASYKKSSEVWADIAKDYTQTLAEIKEIAENREIFCENCSGGCDEFTCEDCGYVKILQKISEVEDDTK